MYTTEGVSAIATVTELRMETADLLDAGGGAGDLRTAQQHPRGGDPPEAAMMSIETYRALRAELKKQATSLKDRCL